MSGMKFFIGALLRIRDVLVMAVFRQMVADV